MKKTLTKKALTLLLVISMLFTFTAEAQIQKGNILAGGDIANFNLGLRKNSAFTVDINPTLAFFIKDNVAIGGMVNLGLVTGAGTTIFDYGVSALGRYYFPDKNNLTPLRHSRFFAEGNVGIRGQNVKDGGSTNGLGIGFGPGYAYFITPSIGLETVLKYNGLIGFGNLTTQSNLALNIGFQIYLPSGGLKTKITNDVK